MTQPHLSPAEIARRLEAVNRRIQHHIDTTGWSIMNSYLPAGEDAVPLAYTIGLTERGLPELMIIGLEPATCAGLLNDLARRATNGQPFTHGQRLDDLLADGLEVTIVDGPADGILNPTIAIHRYGLDAVRLQQCVWPDPEGRFPWDTGYQLRPVVQPVIAKPN